MPVYPAAYQVSDTYYGQPNGFSITVDGKPVRFRTEVRALLAGADVTAQLRKLGLTDAQIAYHENRPVHVHHAYRPFPSGGPGEWSMGRDTAKAYCADAAFLGSWKRLAKREGDADGNHLPARKVSYILKTGNTWKRGIEDFTLNIVKRNPAELVSLCFPGTFKKIDAKTYQVRLRNFQPATDLDVYFGNINLDDDDDDNSGRMPVLAK